MGEAETVSSRVKVENEPRGCGQGFPKLEKIAAPILLWSSLPVCRTVSLVDQVQTDAFMAAPL